MPWFLIIVLLGSTTINYIDRIAISVLAPTLRDEFGMTNSQYALVVNCFMFSYLIMYSVGGRLADIASTVLELMGLEKPVEMTGQSLLSGTVTP